MTIPTGRATKKMKVTVSTANVGRPTGRAKLYEPKQEKLSEAGQCDLAPRTASPERNGRELTELGIRLRRSWDRTGRCVSLSLRMESTRSRALA